MLKEIGTPSIKALAHAMKDRDPDVRLKVLDTLGDLRSREAEPIVLTALTDGNSDVRWRAVLTSQKIGISPAHLPRWLALRPRNRKNPLVAGFLNFMLPGLGYGYLGRWWGIMIFQIDITLTVWLFKFGVSSVVRPIPTASSSRFTCCLAFTRGTWQNRCRNSDPGLSKVDDRLC